ncbi:hypothetical protein Q5752_000086 [Cryptotrichosporon argae]
MNPPPKRVRRSASPHQRGTRSPSSASTRRLELRSPRSPRSPSPGAPGPEMRHLPAPTPSNPRHMYQPLPGPSSWAFPPRGYEPRHRSVDVRSPSGAPSSLSPHDERHDDDEGAGGPGAMRLTRETGRAPRSMMACMRCRRQKMKCDGPEHRPCRGCQASGTECQFEPRSRKAQSMQLPRTGGVGYGYATASTPGPGGSTYAPFAGPVFFPSQPQPAPPQVTPGAPPPGAMSTLPTPPNSDWTPHYGGAHARLSLPERAGAAERDMPPPPDRYPRGPPPPPLPHALAHAATPHAQLHIHPSQHQQPTPLSSPFPHDTYPAASYAGPSSASSSSTIAPGARAPSPAHAVDQRLAALEARFEAKRADDARRFDEVLGRQDQISRQLQENNELLRELLGRRHEGPDRDMRRGERQRSWEREARRRRSQGLPDGSVKRPDEDETGSPKRRRGS